MGMYDGIALLGTQIISMAYPPHWFHHPLLVRILETHKQFYERYQNYAVQLQIELQIVFRQYNVADATDMDITQLIAH
jgi:hypothetical protein